MFHVPRTKKDLNKLKKSELIDLSLTLINEVESLTLSLFGKSSERYKGDPIGMKPLFDEVECIVEEDEEKSSDEENKGENKSPKPKKTGGKRTKLSSVLIRNRVEHDLRDKDKKCKIHGNDLVKIGENTREELKIVPAQVSVTEHVTFTYKCNCCEKENSDNDTHNSINAFIKSESPKFIFPKSFASASLLAFIVVSKFQDSLPLYRLAQIFNRHNVNLNRSLMANWMIKLSELILPLINLMWDDLLDRNVIGCDETPVQVLREPNRKAESKSYMWLTASMHGPPIVLFNYEIGRSAKTATKLLSDFSGVIVCDGLKSYDSYAKNSEKPVVLAGCLAHIRRKIFAADKALRKVAPKITPATKVPLDLIKKLYLIEREIKNESNAVRKEKRQEFSKPIMIELKEWIDKKSLTVLPKSLTGKAITYALDQWDKMQVFLENPEVEIDNNASERYIRQFVMGRKNWMFSTSQKGADSSANLYSLVESAKANGLEPFSYLYKVFKELPYADSIDKYEKLLPHKISNFHKIKPYIKAN